MEPGSQIQGAAGGPVREGPAVASPQAPAGRTRARSHALGAIGFAALAIAAALLALSMPLNGYILNILLQATTYSVAVIGLTVVLGLCGQINLAQAAFFGLGAYAVGLGTVDLGASYWLCVIAGLAISIVFGAFLGASTLRLGGHYLAMVTISFQQIVTLILVNWIPVTHGPDGVTRIGRPSLFPGTQAYLAFSILVLAAVGYAVWRMPETRLGRAMRAVRDNELAAGVAGIDVYRTKVVAFAIAAMLAGLGGALFAGGFAYVSPDQFSFAESIVFLTMALLGGVGSPIGAVIGTALLILIPEWLRFLKEIPGLYLAIYGLSVILIVIFMPEGIWGFVSTWFGRFRKGFAASGTAAELTLTQSATLATETAPALEVDTLSKHFGGLKAVDEVSFAIRRGGIHALIGPNGSGKTTTLNVLSGLYVPTAGRVRLNGQDITDMPPHARAAAGLGRTFQNIRLFRSMTALENVVIGAERPGDSGVAQNRDALLDRARSALAFVGLESRADELVPSFSYGHQRLIEIARALAGNPALLLLDEPAAGLNSSEKNALRDLLQRIAAKGLTILIIDHDMTLVSEVAQHITVLNFGRRIADGETAAVLQEPAVIEAYLGQELLDPELDAALTADLQPV
jgi:branched-chain amino acid transport system permease protein